MKSILKWIFKKIAKYNRRQFFSCCYTFYTYFLPPHWPSHMTHVREKRVKKIDLYQLPVDTRNTAWMDWPLLYDLDVIHNIPPHPTHPIGGRPGSGPRPQSTPSVPQGSSVVTDQVCIHVQPRHVSTPASVLWVRAEWLQKSFYDEISWQIIR